MKKLGISLLIVFLILGLYGCDTKEQNSKQKIVKKPNIQIFSKFSDVAHSKKEGIIRQYVIDGGDLNAIIPEHQNWTLLILAVENNYTNKFEIIKLLLQNGAEASINHKDIFGQTALWLADDPRIAKLLLEYNASPYLRKGNMTIYQMHKKYNPAIANIISNHFQIENKTSNNSKPTTYSATVNWSEDRGDHKEYNVKCNNGNTISISYYYNSSNYHTSGRIFSSLNSAADYACN